jgi:molybdopterin-guanine dinucleotide biosynthesis protein A
MPSAAILAGGRASRFGGRDKSAPVVERQPILDRPLAALVQVADDLMLDVLALTPEADAVVPRTERGYHRLCAAYTRACQPAIAVRLDRRQIRMVDFRADVRVRVVCGDELAALGNHHRLLANINTPAEYEGLDRTIGHEL